MSELTTLGIDFDTDVAEVPDKEMVNVANRPDITQPEWNDFIMTEFHETETDNNGYPRVTGLRRLTEKYLGTIVESIARVVQSPCPDNEKRATVEYIVKILDIDGLVKTYGDAADAYAANIGGDNTSVKNVVTLHPVAVATTRAEARALRKALKLRTISAEEVIPKKVTVVEKEVDGKKVKVAEEVNDTGFIEPHQLNFINVMCKRNNINVWNYVNSPGFLGEHKELYSNPESIPYPQAIKMIKFLQKIQKDLVLNDEQKKRLLGYDENWRKNGGAAP